MASLSLKNLNKSYDNGFCAVKDFNLEIRDKEFIVLTGPSGSGKSAVLRMIAGLEEITSGELWIDGQMVNGIETKNREIAMIFSNYALYEKLTVRENIAFGLKLRNLSQDEINKRVNETAEILNLTHLLERKPKALSEAQRYRVALGRAIVIQPKVLLMDEPLLNLSEKIREQMCIEIAKLHERLGNTIVYVTKNQTEAMELATKIVVMNAGDIHKVFINK